MVAWYEEEWAMKKLAKLEEALASSKHRKIFDQLKPRTDEVEEEDVQRED